MLKILNGSVMVLVALLAGCPGMDDPVDDDSADEPTEYEGDVGAVNHVGPLGGEVTHLAEDPSAPGHLFATVSGVLYESDDEGATWSQSPFDNSTLNTDCELVFTVMFTDDGTLYLGTETKVYRSVDGGETFDSITYNLPGGYTYALAWMDGEPATLWAGLWLNPTTPLWSLAEGETSWQGHTPPAPWEEIGITDVAAAADGLLLATWTDSGFAVGGGVLRFDPALEQFEATGALPDSPFYRVEAHEDLVLVAGGNMFGSLTAGVYSSADVGDSWTREDDGWTELYATEVTRLEDGSLLAGSYMHGLMEADGPGGAWTPVEAYDGYSFLSVLQTASGTRLGGMEVQGIVASADGESWAASSDGIEQMILDDAGADPADRDRMLAISSGQNTGIALATDDGGAHWNGIPALPNPRYSMITIRPSGRWYAGMDGPISYGDDGLYVSEDQGETFRFLGPLGDDHATHTITDVFDSADGQRLVAVGQYFSPATVLVMTSDDGGENWETAYEAGEETNGYAGRISGMGGAGLLVPVYQLDGGLLHIDEQGGSELLEVEGAVLGAMDGGSCRGGEAYYALVQLDEDDLYTVAIQRSEDAGQSWELLEEFGANPAAMGAYGVQLVVHPSDCQVLVLANGDVVRYSLDGGDSWETLAEAARLPLIRNLRLVPLADGEAMILAAGLGGVLTIELPASPL